MIRKPWSTLVSAVVLVVAVGCASPGFQQSESVSIEMRRVKEAAVAFDASARSALSTLEGLSAEPMMDMPSRFETFSAAVSAVDSAKTKLSRAKNGMTRAGAERFDTWERDNGRIVDPTTRKRAEMRRSEVLATFQMAESESQGGGELAERISRDLRNLRTLLSNDLTRAGLAGNGDLINDVREGSSHFTDTSHGWFKALDDAIAATSIAPSSRR